MKKIPLTRNKFALVDDEDFEHLSQWRWCAFWNPNSHSYYALRQSSRRLGKRSHIRMHRILLDAPTGMEVDHIDGDSLNNQKSNLRICTPGQNRFNRNKTKKNTSGYKGVYKSRTRWCARIGLEGRLIHIGIFVSPIDAAKAYDTKAKELFGEFARLNFSEEPVNE